MDYEKACGLARIKAIRLHEPVHVVLDYCDDFGPVYAIATESDLDTWALFMDSKIVFDEYGDSYSNVLNY